MLHLQYVNLAREQTVSGGIDGRNNKNAGLQIVSHVKICSA